MKRTRFSLRTLFAATALVAVILVAAPFAGKTYYRLLATKHMMTGDICAFGDLYDYGNGEGISVDWVDSAIKYAAKKGDTIYLGYFADIADVNHRIHGNWTCLMYTAHHGHFSSVKELLESSADTTLRDKRGFDVIDIARNAGHKEIEQLLLSSQLESWNNVLDIENLIHDLQHDRFGTAADLQQLLATPKYEILNSLISDVRTTPRELVWFRASDEINIAPYNNGGFAWMVNGKRINDVW